jgi:hypothetical protein
MAWWANFKTYILGKTSRLSIFLCWFWFKNSKNSNSDFGGFQLPDVRSKKSKNLPDYFFFEVLSV